MANIKRIDGKTGVSFKITVTNGRDPSGKQKRHFKTWRPEPKMTERQIDREVQRVAFEFERELKRGFAADDRQTFAEYARYVLDLKERKGLKASTLDRYMSLLDRICPAIGHLKLADIRPKHLNDLYKNLGESGISKRGDKAVSRSDLYECMALNSLTRAGLASNAGVSSATITAACQDKKIDLASAEAIAKALNQNVNKLFLVERDNSPLSSKTVLEHHRLIRMILGVAEDEMLVSYNAASKASPPEIKKSEPNYFQVRDVERIRDALETEPLKWRVITHLLLLSGCRRGEIMGLKWSRVDFKNSRIKIDSALLYSSKRGIYEETTKTENIRNIKLPAETMRLLLEYRGWYLEQKFKNGDRWHNTDYLFTKDDGAPMAPDGITAWLIKFSQKHGLPHVNPHAFRHTMGSILLKSGADIVSVSKRLGHAQTSTTLNIYSHVMEDADEQNSESLADTILRPRKAQKKIG